MWSGSARGQGDFCDLLGALAAGGGEAELHSIACGHERPLHPYSLS